MLKHPRASEMYPDLGNCDMTSGMPCTSSKQTVSLVYSMLYGSVISHLSALM